MGYSIYESIIIPSLYSSGYKKSDILDYENSDYIVTYNMMADDNNSMSCIIFKETGVMKMMNSSIMIKGKEYTTVTLTTWLRSLGCGLTYYIPYQLFDMDIDRNIMYVLSDYIQNKMLNMPQPYNKYYEKIRKDLYKRYVLDIDILGISEMAFDVYKMESKEKPEKVATKMEIVESNPFEKSSIMSYIEKRGIKLAIEKNNVLLRTIIQNDIYRKPAVVFCYEGGFSKYRIVNEKSKKYRFRSNGRYTDFFHVRVNGSKRLYVIEGEIEGFSISSFVDDDIVCMHNTNSLPSNISLFDNYDEIVVKIDKDQYANNYKIFLETKYNVIVDYKLEDETKDYNDYLVENKLTKEMIETINNK